MPDGYGNPNYARPDVTPVRRERFPSSHLEARIKRLERRLDRMDAKLARRDKKIARLERLTKDLD